MASNNKKTIKFGEYIAEVTGINDQREKISFKLRYDEIKHIRRVLRAYDNKYSRLYPKDPGSDELTRRLYEKFYQNFGKMKRSLPAGSKKSKIKQMVKKNGLICSHPGCKEKDNLTIDHIQKVSVIDNANDVKNLQFLCPKHHLLKNLKTHKWHKEIEIDKLNQRIADIEKKGTTDALGFKVLSREKFEDLEADDKDEVKWED